jgi:four helix bundle protein
MAQSFHDLTVWHRAMEMTTAVYKTTQYFPRSEMFGLTSPLRRASVSVASNIAEGRGRLSQGEFRKFLGMAQGSNCEVQTQIIVARNLRLGNLESLAEAEHLSIEVGKMLSALITTVETKS